ncbi:MAG: hypothetical protein FJ150_03425 [Euryarchaeota archaeon]|nr:hypothetical protein [Euryarchaeota archaeon]
MGNQEAKKCYDKALKIDPYYIKQINIENAPKILQKNQKVSEYFEKFIDFASSDSKSAMEKIMEILNK